MFEDEIIDYLAKYNGFSKDYKNLFPSKEETISLLMKVTLPNELEDSFYHMENKYLKSLNKRFEYLDAKKVKYVNNMAVYKGNVSKIKGDILVNPLATPIYNPQNLMIKELNDELINYGGLEIRRDLLNENAKRGKSFQDGDYLLTDAYNLAYKKILSFKLPTDGHSMEEINSLSQNIISLWNSLKKERPHYVVIACEELESSVVTLLIKTFVILLKTISYDMHVLFVDKKDERVKEYNELIKQK